MLLSIGPLATNFRQIVIKIQNFLFKKMHPKTSSAKRRPFCPGGDEFKVLIVVLLILKKMKSYQWTSGNDWQKRWTFGSLRWKMLCLYRLYWCLGNCHQQIAHRFVNILRDNVIVMFATKFQQIASNTLHVTNSQTCLYEYHLDISSIKESIGQPISPLLPLPLPFSCHGHVPLQGQQHPGNTWWRHNS